MAAPDKVTLHNLGGTFVLNKSLSDSSDSVLAMQGVSWLVRQAIKYSTITLHVKEYVDDQDKTHIDIEQVASAGSSNLEERMLDWAFQEKTDRVFGHVKGRSRFIKVEDIDEPYLKQGWDQKFLDDGGNELVESYTESLSSTWTADQTWGFEVIGGERRYVRHVFAKKGKEEHRIKLVYDWQG
ncbi:hypothetical protein AAFC00_001745 [Neodothiora populina]|uniref:Uncharacterized protein n=1 Tax=Neodothiora populina TaxID=2781224 RepID=A0ABR3PQ56_9PEZI